LEAVRLATKGVELIFHHAAIPSVLRSIKDPLPTHAVCAGGTLHGLLSAREAAVRRVIYRASACAYGGGARAAPRELELLHPASPYAVATLAAEHYCAAFASAHGLETVRLRYFNVFGPRQAAGSPYSAVVPQLVASMLAGQRPVIQGDGQQVRDFVADDDVVQANLLAAAAPRVSGRVYNIGSGRRTPVLELVGRLNCILGTDLKPIHTLPRPCDFRHSQADISRAQADLGYLPCTDLEQTLHRCV